MKCLITYYSFSGNTDKAAQTFAKALKARGEVTIQRLKPRNEIKNFFSQCMAAFTRKRACLEGNIIFNVSQYDLVLIGSPVWAFAPTPAINTYLDRLNGLNGKKALIFLTRASGAGVKRCLDNIKSVLKAKGASEVYEVNIQDRRVSDEGHVLSFLKKFL